MATMTVVVSILAVCQAGVAQDTLPFLELGTTAGVSQIFFDNGDDVTTPAINISSGFPFVNTTHNSCFVCDNGFLTFGLAWNGDEQLPTPFADMYNPVGDRFILAPFWYDQDIRTEGEISYEVHEMGISPKSDEILRNVSDFVSQSNGNVTFQGRWMLVAFWDRVHVYHPPAPLSSFPQSFQDLLMKENTYQALVITDSQWQSYAIFTYKCGLLEWSGDSPFYAVIGYSALGLVYEDHPFSYMASVNDIACLNSPASEWSNVIYNLTDPADIPIQDPGTSSVSLSTLQTSVIATPTLHISVIATPRQQMSSVALPVTSPSPTRTADDSGGDTTSSGIPPVQIIPPIVIVVILVPLGVTLCIVLFLVLKKRDKNKVETTELRKVAPAGDVDSNGTRDTDTTPFFYQRNDKPVDAN